MSIANIYVNKIKSCGNLQIEYGKGLSNNLNIPNIPHKFLKA